MQTASTSKNTSTSPRFEFWFEFASTYSYLSAGRITDLARIAGIPITWRPFLLGPIFQSQGWNDSPFNLYPAKGRYMWRDLERKCEQYDLAYQKPSEFPRNGLHAARIVTALLENAKTTQHVPAFIRAIYEANFARDHNIAEEFVLNEILRELGLTSDELSEIVSLSKTSEIKLKLRETTKRAQALEIFGAPSFTISYRSAGSANSDIKANENDPGQMTELFWGDDRLEDAFAFYHKIQSLQET